MVFTHSVFPIPRSALCVWWLLVALLSIGADRGTHADAPSDSAQATHFEQLLKRRPHDPALQYNLGTARYQEGHYDKASESLSAAMASSGSSLQSRASYNLGNTHYRLGRAAEQTNPNQAADFYRNALEDYRLAIRHDPRDVDAKYNYELVERRLSALKTQQVQQQSGKSQSQQADQQAAAQQANDQSAHGEQAHQEQQHAQAQPQQAGQSGESQQQHDASAESKPASESQSSMDTAQGAEQQRQGQHTQLGQPQPGQQPSERQAQQATETGSEAQDMSQQQALWILDTLKNEERGALLKQRQGMGRESDVEHDW